MRALRPTERARGRVLLSAKAAEGGASTVAELAQAGSGRVLFPHRVAADDALEAVIVNVGGGIAGGDRFEVSLAAQAGARLVASTQACEKVYRSDGRTAEVSTALAVAAGASLAWLPQETILFDRAKLARTLEVTLAATARCLVCDAVILGRHAMGESVTSAAFHDSWRVKRGGRLVFAEETRFDGDLAPLAAPSGLAGRTGFATFVMAGPNLADRRDRARAMIERDGHEAGVSIVGDLLVCRLVAVSGITLRAGLSALVRELSDQEPPRVWHI
jgi:urease accessory protein